MKTREQGEQVCVSVCVIPLPSSLSSHDPLCLTRSRSVSGCLLSLPSPAQVSDVRAWEVAASCHFLFRHANGGSRPLAAEVTGGAAVLVDTEGLAWEATYRFL